MVFPYAGEVQGGVEAPVVLCAWMAEPAEEVRQSCCTGGLAGNQRMGCV